MITGRKYLTFNAFALALCGHFPAIQQIHKHRFGRGYQKIQNMEYKASLDALAKGITIGVFILFIAIGQQSVRAILVAKGDTAGILIHSGMLLLFVAILLGSWLYAPQSYTLDRNELTINRPIGKVKIKLGDLKQVRLLADNETKGTIRTFGVGGLFGYFGKFYMPGIGHATFYATQRKNRILIVTNNDKIWIITPDDNSMAEKLKL